MAKQQKTSFYELSAYVQNIFARLGVDRKSLIVENYSDDLIVEGLTMTTRGGKLLATLGVVSRSVNKKMDIDCDVFYADLEWNNLMSAIKKHKVSYEEISKFPEVKRDLALLLDKSVTFADIARTANDTERRLLKNISLFDVYEGKNLPEGKKSYAVSFILQDMNKTLTDTQIDGIMNKFIKNFEEKLSAKIR